ncbi:MULTISPECIES: hypothetical protein [unclassified Streptomyces]
MVTRWNRRRTRSPVRSKVTEAVITTALISLVIVVFGALLATVLANP